MNVIVLPGPEEGVTEPCTAVDTQCHVLPSLPVWETLKPLRRWGKGKTERSWGGRRGEFNTTSQTNPALGMFIPCSDVLGFLLWHTLLCSGVEVVQLQPSGTHQPQSHSDGPALLSSKADTLWPFRCVLAAAWRKGEKAGTSSLIFSAQERSQFAHHSRVEGGCLTVLERMMVQMETGLHLPFPPSKHLQLRHLAGDGNLESLLAFRGYSTSWWSSGIFLFVVECVCARMCVYMCVYVCACVCIVYICMYMWCIHVYVCACIVYVCVHECVHECVYVCPCVNLLLPFLGHHCVFSLWRETYQVG